MNLKTAVEHEKDVFRMKESAELYSLYDPILKTTGLSHSCARCLLQTGTSPEIDEEVISKKCVVSRKREEQKSTASLFSFSSSGPLPFHFSLLTFHLLQPSFLICSLR